MPISQTICDSYKTEILNGIHAFSTTVVRGSTAADTFKLALYSSSASLGGTTTIYTTTDEISGTGYVAGGKILTVNPTPTFVSGVAFVSFDNCVWSGASFTAAGGLIYNSSQGNRAVAVLDFGSNKTVSNQPFTVIFPLADYTNAIVRVG